MTKITPQKMAKEMSKSNRTTSWRLCDSRPREMQEAVNFDNNTILTT